MILVDGIATHATSLRWKRWSHMVSTVSVDELHHMAAMIGLKREWFQPDSFAHYDVTPSRRTRAIKLGAFEVSSRAVLFLNHDYPLRRRVRPCDRCASSGAESAGAFVDDCPTCDVRVYLAELRR